MKKVPHLTTALKGSLLELEKKCLSMQEQIESWFCNKWKTHRAPLYGSVDLRNSGFKLSTVDMNLFPGGFNNLNPEFLPLASCALDNFFKHNYPNFKKILLIPENHTRNVGYLHNVNTLKHILEQAGLEVVIGSISPEMVEDKMEISLDENMADSMHLTYHRLCVKKNILQTVSGFIPDFILLNNDLTIGIPDILHNIAQPILPPPHLGWHNRKKTDFFEKYNVVCTEFAQLIGIDPWQINPYFAIADVDFANKIGLDNLALQVDSILDKIRTKYQEKNINKTPYVVIKANNGTYGRGIMVAKSGDEIININRKDRNKMSVIKEGSNVNEVIIQEGVYTFEEVDNSAAEPVIYMIDNAVIGGFYRVHPTRNTSENLNAPGAKFTPLEFNCPCVATPENDPDCEPNRFYTYGVIARLALLASSYEISGNDTQV